EGRRRGEGGEGGVELADGAHRVEGEGLADVGERGTRAVPERVLRVRRLGEEGGLAFGEEQRGARDGGAGEVEEVAARAEGVLVGGEVARGRAAGGEQGRGGEAREEGAAAGGEGGGHGPGRRGGGGSHAGSIVVTAPPRPRARRRGMRGSEEMTSAPTIRMARLDGG